MLPRRGPILVAAILLVLTPMIPAATAQPDQTQEIELHCRPGRAEVASMEAEYARFGCWAHVGHHQYLVGNETVYQLWGGEGTAKSVEQHFSVPLEPGEVSPAAVQLNTTVPIETSMDGRTWRPVHDAQYRFFPGEDRQNVGFSFEADGRTFRFVRVRQPLGAGQGLAGFLDKSVLTLEVTAQRDVQDPPLKQRTVDLSCAEAILEDIYPGHPCTFGGVDRWESPSFFHTYFLGDARLDAIRGEFVTRDWRPDDLGFPIGQGDGVLVQTSRDGVHWTTVGTENTIHGVPGDVQVDLDDHPAKFVRIASARHPGWGDHPALKHPASMFLRTNVTVAGELPPNLG